MPPVAQSAPIPAHPVGPTDPCKNLGGASGLLLVTTIWPHGEGPWPDGDHFGQALGWEAVARLGPNPVICSIAPPPKLPATMALRRCAAFAKGVVELLLHVSGSGPLPDRIFVQQSCPWMHGCRRRRRRDVTVCCGFVWRDKPPAVFVGASHKYYNNGLPMTRAQEGPIAAGAARPRKSIVIVPRQRERCLRAQACFHAVSASMGLRFEPAPKPGHFQPRPAN